MYGADGTYAQEEIDLTRDIHYTLILLSLQLHKGCSSRMVVQASMHTFFPMRYESDVECTNSK